MQVDDGKDIGYKEIAGGVSAAQGISACGISIGLRKKPDSLDLALVTANAPVTAAGVFTQNKFCAAPVSLCREHLLDGHAQAVVLNSAIANAATGQPGMDNANKAAQVLAEELGCKSDDVLVASTGVIGVQLDIEKFVWGIPKAVAALSAQGGSDAAQAIITTDTFAKECAFSYEYAGHTYIVGGMCKGSGMIMPDMATMLAVLTTDVPISSELAAKAIKHAADLSFNKVTVDSDTSTNDTCILLATGEAGGQEIVDEGPAYTCFLNALSHVCECLAKKIAVDGEGATKLVVVNVSGAANDADADLCARAIANSPLVKTAIAGHDANWGRIAAAAGKSGASFEQEDVDIDIVGIPVMRSGLPVEFDEDAALAAFEPAQVDIDIDLGAGNSSCRIWTCDLTHGYITINADYRS